jgi:arsenate reductase
MGRAPGKPTILFLCTGNSCRSQMAEGWTRKLFGDRFDVYSAGLEPRELDPRAVRVMREAGIDISGQRSKHVDELSDIEFDHVITVCDNAKENCPFFPARVKLLHRSFDDPPHLAAGAQSEEEALALYRRIRDEIRAFVETLPVTLRIESKEN